MDDTKRTSRIAYSKPLLVLVFIVLVGLTIALYLYSIRIGPEEGAVSEQFNSFSASMRHNFKVTHLNHKAYDAVLVALINDDENQLSIAKNYMEASLGFINVQYIQREPLIQRVVPLIKENIALIDKHGISMDQAVLDEVRSSFSRVYEELAEHEKIINIEVQKLHSRQLAIQKRWKHFYVLIIITSVTGLLTIVILALKQRSLIRSLERNEQKLKTQSKERIEAEREKVKLAEQLHQAQKMESIGLMAGSVAHDLNNILAGIVGYPELMLKTLPQESELRKPLTAIHDSGSRATLVVADLLTIARGVATAKSNQNINEIINEYFRSPEFIQLASMYPGISYTLHLKPEELWIRCSPVHVKKCIMNLVINGFEAIGGSGAVTVETDIVDGSLIFLQTEAGDSTDFIKVNISDTGEGIPQQDLESIFDPFYSKKKIGRSGSGLGLTIVWNTMEDHNGKVSVENTGEGTCFSLYLPKSDVEGMAKEPTAEEVGITAKAEKILVVDDEEQIRDLAEQMLNNAGFSVNTVSSGEDAIKFLEENIVDLVVLDMIMNPGMNGYETFKQITQLHPDQKALIASGYSESEDVKRTLQKGALSFIGKPYSSKQLIKEVRLILYGEKEVTHKPN